MEGCSARSSTPHTEDWASNMWRQAVGRLTPALLGVRSSGLLPLRMAIPQPYFRVSASSKYPFSGTFRQFASNSEKKAGSTGKGGDENILEFFKKRMNELGDKSGGPSGSSGPTGSNDIWKRRLTSGVFAGALTLALYYFLRTDGTVSSEISWQAFRSDMLAENRVERLICENGQLVRVILHPEYAERDKASGAVVEPYFRIVDPAFLDERLSTAQEALGKALPDFIPISYVQKHSYLEDLLKLLPAILIIGMWIYVGRRLSSQMGGGGGGGGGPGGPGGIFSVGKSKAFKATAENTNTRFKDVAGLVEAKEEVMEFVEFLKDPSRFQELGAQIPKGCLLTGPPGTGKTLLAKAMAGEAGVPFFAVSGSEFIEMFVGVGPSRIRDLFASARKEAPAIVFIDEIDAIGRQRGKTGFQGGHDERENTLNQLLVEMDGFTQNSSVVVVAGTNRADVLDSALLRPGRFDRTIAVDKPDLAGRAEIFAVHLERLKLAAPIARYAGILSGLTPGFVGADIMNICNEAALIAAREEAEAVRMIHFQKAVERVIGGMEKKNSVQSKDERRVVAVHESGHAVVGWFLQHTDPLVKVSIVPRASAALGYAQYLPREVHLMSKEAIFDRLCMTLGGRAAEMVFFDSVTTGASDDLMKVTQLAYASVTSYGLHPSVGLFHFAEPAGGQMQTTRPYSDSLAWEIDEQAYKLIGDALAASVALIREKEDLLRQLSTRLLEKEVLNHEDLVEILGPRPFPATNDEYETYLQAPKLLADSEESDAEIRAQDAKKADEMGKEENEKEKTEVV